MTYRNYYFLKSSITEVNNHCRNVIYLSVFKGTSKLNKAQQATENQTIKHIKQGQVY